MAHALRFLTTFVRRPGSVGAVWPSSRRLADLLAGSLELGSGDLVLEYGPGTGPITAVLAEQVKRGARYLGIELDAGFVAVLRRRFPELEFVHGSVVDVERHLRERAIDRRARYVISGLPFASLPAQVQLGTIDGVDAVLADGGEFRTFQYVHAYGLPAARRFRAMMRERFPHLERRGPVLRNVPPAYVLVYRR